VQGAVPAGGHIAVCSHAGVPGMVVVALCCWQGGEAAGTGLGIRVIQDAEGIGS